MSAPLPGKFQDHYAILDVDPRADSDTIQKAYARLAQKYHPTKGASPDKAKFDDINEAYQILSDPQLRTEFDRIKGVSRDGGKPQFSGVEFFDALNRAMRLRDALLCVLYDRRRTKPFTPSLPMRSLEQMLATTSEELNFALWYLKKRSMVASDDTSSLQITVEGMDFLEAHPPKPTEVMPLIHQESVKNTGTEGSVMGLGAMIHARVAEQSVLNR